MEFKETKPEFPDLNLPQRVEGRNLHYAPRPVSGSYYPVTGTLTSGSSSDPMVDADAIILTKLINSHNELVAALIKLGLIKKN